MSKIPNWLILAIAVFAFLGAMDALYLTVNHYSGAYLNCAILDGCNEVAQSKYSIMFGIPLALLGLIYYAVVLLSSLLYFDTKKAIFVRPIPTLVLAGFLFSIYLTFLQIFVIKALCIYCVASAINSVVLFVLGLLLFRHQKARK